MTSRRKFLNTTIGLAALTCAFAAAPAAQAQQAWPDYYPQNYGEIVEASKSENGLLIFSNMAEYNWAPVIEGFNALYPWIKVQTFDMNSSEVFSRYFAEANSNAVTGDLLATGSIEGWMDFRDRGAIMDYESPELGKLPEWSVPSKGLYTVSTDPMIIVYNKQTMPDGAEPQSVKEIADLVAANPDNFKNAVTTYNGLSPFGAPIHWNWLNHGGEGAESELKTLGSVAVPEETGGAMLAKLTSGEYKVGYFLSGISVFPKLKDALAQLLGWSFPSDGTPLVMRGVAIPEKSTNVNSAKLMLDYILSNAGQTAFGKGGLTPYREDVETGDGVAHTYGSIVEEVGQDNVFVVGYDDEFLKSQPEFQRKWLEAFSR